jgi:hypothetical protein
MAGQVGSAYVIVRALTNKIGSDVKRGIENNPDIDSALDNLGKKISDKVGSQVGESVTSSVSKAVKKGGPNVGRDLGNAIKRGLRRVMPSAWVDTYRDARRNVGPWVKYGAAIGDSIGKGLRKIPLLVAFGPWLMSGLGGLLKIVEAYVGGAVAIIGRLGPAAAAAGVGFVGVYATVGQAALTVMAALKAETPTLEKFKKDTAGLKTQFTDIAESIQKQLLPAVASAGKKLMSSLGPIFRKQLSETGSVLAGVIRQFTALGQTPYFKSNLKAVLDGNNKSLGFLGSALVTAADSAMILLKNAQPMLNFFTEWVNKLSQSANMALRTADANGSLADWFARAQESLRQLGRITGYWGRALGNVFASGNEAGGTLLDSIERIGRKFEAWTNSIGGKQSLKNFFDNSLPVMSEVSGIIGDIAKALFGNMGKAGGTNSLAAGLKDFRENTLPSLVSISQSLTGSLGTEIQIFAKALELLLNVPGLGNLIVLSLGLSRFATVLNILTLGQGSKAIGGLVGGLGGIIAKSAMFTRAATAVKAFGFALQFNAAMAASSTIAFMRNAAAVVAQRIATVAATIASNAMKIAQMALNIVMSMNPIGLIVAAIVALVAGFVLAYKKVDWFRKAVDTLWQWLQKLWDAFLAIVKVVIEKLKPVLVIIGRAIKTYVITYFKVWIAVIKTVWTVVRTVFTKVRDFIKGVFEKVGDAAKGIWDGIVNGIKTVINGIKGALNTIIGLYNLAIQGANKVISIANNIPGVSLPSIPEIPKLAKGGVVMPQAGGTLALLAERGRAERVEPLDRNGLSVRDRALIQELAGGSGNVQVRVFIGERELTDIVQTQVSKNNRHLSRRMMSGRQVALA